MFSCKSCTKLLIKTVASEEYAQVIRRKPFFWFATAFRRSGYGTVAKCEAKVRDPEEQARIEVGLPPDVQTFKEAGVTAMKGNEAIQRYKRGQDVTNTLGIKELRSFSVLDGNTPVDMTKLKRHAKLELQYIEEPYALAERSLLLLKNGEVDQALELVRMAGKNGMEATVSWNHILNTLTKAGHLHTAWKLFNEMKKLGQKPDSYTITILLRGYKDRVKNKSPRILKALHIYDSMFKPNSSVKPQIIHSNAMLEACGRAGDLEMMFSVAARLKESGANSPDDITYTIIFNAIANAASGDQKNDHRLISHARSIWLDALKYWKTGRLVMNEQLVCSLGRVLLTGQYQSDRDDVFSLIQQTMRILRQFDRLGEEKSLHRVEDQVRMAESTVLQTENEKEAAARSLRGPEITSPEAEFDFNTLFDNAEQSQSQRSNDTNVSGSGEAISFQIIPEVGTEFIGHPDSSMNVVSKPEFDIIEAAGLVLAKPGNMTLSLLINACASIKQYDGAMKYWNLLKEKIPPDTLNYTDYMKLLKEARDSSAATNLLREIYKSSKDRKRDIQRIPMFFLYAMGACVEARQKTTALCDGTRILAILQMCAVEPQPQLVKMFTQIIARGQGHFPVKDVERAVESLMITFGNLKSLYAFGRTDGNGLNGTSAALTEVIHDVDSGWQPRIERNRFGLAKRRQEQLVEARSSVPMPERKDLRGLGRDIESVIGRVLDLYKKSMTQEQVSRIRADLLRVRAWIFPRHGEWKKLSHVENRQATDLSQLQENAQTYTQRPSYKEDYTANRHVGQNWNARNSYPHSDLGHMPTQRTSSSLADNIKIH